MNDSSAGTQGTSFPTTIRALGCPQQQPWDEGPGRRSSKPVPALASRDQWNKGRAQREVMGRAGCPLTEGKENGNGNDWRARQRGAKGFCHLAAKQRQHPPAAGQLDGPEDMAAAGFNSALPHRVLPTLRSLPTSICWLLFEVVTLRALCHTAQTRVTVSSRKQQDSHRAAHPPSIPRLDPPSQLSLAICLSSHHAGSIPLLPTSPCPAPKPAPVFPFPRKEAGSSPPLTRLEWGWLIGKAH